MIQKKPFRFYFRCYWRPLTLGVITLFFTNLFDAFPPLILKRGIDQITQKAPLNELAMTTLWFFIVIGLVAIFRYFWRIGFGHFNQSAADDLRRRIFNKFTEMSPTFYQTNPVGQLMTLISNDVTNFRIAIGPGVLILLDAIFISAIVLPLMWQLSPSWTWKTLICLPFIPFLIAKIQIVLQDRFQDQQAKFSELSASSQEIVSGIRVIKSFVQEKNRLNMFNQKSREFEQLCLRAGKIEAFFSPVMEFGITSGAFILILLGSQDVLEGAVSVGTFIAFFQMIKKMVWPMTAFGLSITMIQEGRSSLNRILQILKGKSDVPDNGQIHIKDFKEIHITDLNFTYPGSQQPALQNLNLTIRKGTTIGITGTVGSGKSTLINLLCRLYPTTPKSILIDGIPIEEINLSSLRNLFGLIPQDPFLFSDSVQNNISLGLEEPPSIEILQQYCQKVSLDQEVLDLPNSYETLIGERGVTLSGGQKQRLTIARALIRNCPILVFDDSLSSVDSSTEEFIFKEILNQTKKENKKTLILITHKISSLKTADNILFFENGKIDAQGRHEELYLSHSSYRHLCDLQNIQRKQNLPHLK